ncbi:MAG: hypothetical protein ACREH3_13260 [Geminicoccales bacterium]
MAERHARRSARRPGTWLIAAALLAAPALLPTSAQGEGGERLAGEIAQSLTGIEDRTAYAPDQAARDLDEQERLLDLLAEQEPGNSRIAPLRRRVEEVRGELAKAQAEGSGDQGKALPDDAPPDQLPTDRVPKAFDDGLEAVDRMTSEAEAELYQEKPDQAAARLDQAAAAMAELERRYAEQIPPGHVPLMVTQERIAALKDQLSDARKPD